MINVNWNPMPYVGPIPVNWYGLTFGLGFAIGFWLVWRWAAQMPTLRAHLEPLMLWIVGGTVTGARLYYVAQNDTMQYLSHPWHILAVWEGGLAYFGGLFGALAAAFIYLRRERLRFWKTGDVFAPAIAIGSAIGRLSCGLDGMDYGTPTSLPWGVVYRNLNSFAPIDGVARHPDQFYELFGDLAIAWVLLRLRGKLPDGVLFLTYMALFSILRFFVFFVRGNVPPVALGLKNAQWTALAFLVFVAAVLLWRTTRGGRHMSSEHSAT
jgi:phosphatidylglycerol:prolipoprotein diacylglycerol transferase